METRGKPRQPTISWTYDRWPWSNTDLFWQVSNNSLPSVGYAFIHLRLRFSDWAHLERIKPSLSRGLLSSRHLPVNSRLPHNTKSSVHSILTREAKSSKEKMRYGERASKYHFLCLDTNTIPLSHILLVHFISVWKGHFIGTKAYIENKQKHQNKYIKWRHFHDNVHTMLS